MCIFKVQTWVPFEIGPGPKNNMGARADFYVIFLCIGACLLNNSTNINSIYLKFSIYGKSVGSIQNRVQSDKQNGPLGRFYGILLCIGDFSLNNSPNIQLIHLKYVMCIYMIQTYVSFKIEPSSKNNMAARAEFQVILLCIGACLLIISTNINPIHLKYGMYYYMVYALSLIHI